MALSKGQKKNPSPPKARLGDAPPVLLTDNPDADRAAMYERAQVVEEGDEVLESRGDELSQLKDRIAELEQAKLKARRPPSPEKQGPRPRLKPRGAVREKGTLLEMAGAEGPDPGKVMNVSFVGPVRDPTSLMMTKVILNVDDKGRRAFEWSDHWLTVRGERAVIRVPLTQVMYVGLETD